MADNNQVLTPVEVKTVHLELLDHSEENHPPLKVKLEYGPQFIEVYPEGYGHCEIEDGYGSCVALEYYKGRLRLIVNADINESEPQIIDLEGARESNRIKEEGDGGL